MNPLNFAHSSSRVGLCSLVLGVALGGACPARAAETSAASHFRKEIEPLLQKYCWDCHAEGTKKGEVSFDEFKSLDELVGKLVTGEQFTGVRELKQILKEKHRADFYRCLTEKLLIYALGRGLEDYDTETVDRIVARLEKEDGHFSALLSGIIESAPFQKQRNLSAMADLTPATAPVKAVQKKATP